MRQKLFFLTPIIGIVIILFGSCNGASIKSSSDSDNNNAENESEDVSAFTIVPVIRDRESYPLQEIVQLWYEPEFAFKDKHGQYLRFDNDEEYSGLCAFPFLIKGFLMDDMTNNHNNLKRATVMKELCASFNIPYESTIIGHWGELEKFDTEEIRTAIKNHYNFKVEEAFNMIINDFVLYLNGNKNKIDPDVLIEIERFIYDNGHPEHSSVYQTYSIYNLQRYEINVNRYWNGTSVFPVIDRTYITLRGDTIPKGSLIMGYII